MYIHKQVENDFLYTFNLYSISYRHFWFNLIPKFYLNIDFKKPRSNKASIFVFDFELLLFIVNMSVKYIKYKKREDFYTIEDL